MPVETPPGFEPIEEPPGFEPVTEELPEVSGMGTLGRELAMSALPAVGSAIGARAGAAGIGLATANPIAALAGTGIGAVAGGVGTDIAQRAAMEAIAPDFYRRIQLLEQAGRKQHPVYGAIGRFLGALGTFSFAPGVTARGIAALPSIARGTATEVEKAAAASAATQVGFGPATTAVATPIVSRIREGEWRAPTVGELAESTIQAGLLGQPKIPGLRIGANVPRGTPPPPVTTEAPPPAPFRYQANGIEIEIIDTNLKKQTALVRPVNEPDAPSTEIPLRMVTTINPEDRGAIYGETTGTVRPVRTQPQQGAGQVPAQEGGAKAPSGGGEPTQTTLGEIPLREQAAQLSDTDLVTLWRSTVEEANKLSQRDQRMGRFGPRGQAVSGEQQAAWEKARVLEAELQRRGGPKEAPAAEEAPPPAGEEPNLQNLPDEGLALLYRALASETNRPGRSQEERQQLQQQLDLLQGEVNRRGQARAAAPEPELTAEEQALIKAAQDELKAAGIDTGELSRLPEGLDPNRPFAGVALATPTETGVGLNYGEFRKWLGGIKPQDRQRAIKALIAEEGIHRFALRVISEADAAGLWNSLTGIEKNLVLRSYRGRSTRQFSDAQLGHEYLRRVMQRLLRTGVREVEEARGLSWLSEKAIDFLERIAVGLRRFIGKNEILDNFREQVEDAIFTLTGRPPQGVAPEAFRKSRKEKAEEGQARMFLPPMQEGETRPTLGELAPTLQRLTPTELRSAGQKYLTQAAGAAPKDVRKQFSFRAYAEAMRRRFGEEIGQGQLQDEFIDSVWSNLIRAPGATLEGLRQRFSLEHLSRGPIPDAAQERPLMEREVIGEERKAVEKRERLADTAGQRRRANVISQIARKVIGSLPQVRPVNRKVIDPAEIKLWKDNAVRPIGADEYRLSNIGDILTQNSGVDRTGPGITESVTQRVTALLNNQTGSVHLVSTYKTGRGQVYIVDPANVRSPRPGVPLKALLDKKISTGQPLYRPIDSYLVEPVKNFHQSFASIEQYQDQFKRLVSEQAAKTAGYAPPEEVVQPQVYGPEPPRGLIDTEASAILGHLYETKEPETRGDVRESFNALLSRSNEGTLTARDRQVLSGLRNIARRIEATTDLRGDDAVAAALDALYDQTRTAEGREQFITGLLGRFATPPEAGVRQLTGREAPAETGARELILARDIAPTTVRPEQVPPGTAVPPAPGRGPRAAIEGPAPEAFRKDVEDTLLAPVRGYSEWMTERMARATGGTTGGAVARAFGQVANEMISRERGYYGQLTSLLDPARRAAGQNNEGTRWLHGMQRVTPRTAIENSIPAMEGTITVPTAAQGIVQLAQRANLAIGQLLQPVARAFQASGLFQRNLTSLGYDIIRRGEGDLWEAWTDGLAVANGRPVNQVRDFFRRWKAALDDPSTDTTTMDRINQDFRRNLPKAISHLKTWGGWEPVIHSDLFNYLENAARQATHARAFREFFPVGSGTLRPTVEAIRAELSPKDQANFEGLLRALQGHPTDSYTGLASWLTPDSPVGVVSRALNQTLGNFMARLVLTGQMFVQPGENIFGAAPQFLGYRNYLEGMARLLRGGMKDQLEQNGAVNRVFYDMSQDPKSPIRSAFRRAGNTISRAFGEQILNELQEAHAAVTARVVGDRIRAGTLSGWEQRMLPETFKAMGFNPAEVTALMSGNQRLLAQFERKAASFLTAGNKAIAEGSRLGASRLFNSLFRFQSYPMAKANQFRKVFGAMVEAQQTGRNRRAATEQFARFMVGTALQGAFTVGLTSLFYEGPEGTKIRVEEAKDEPLEFMLDAAAGSMAGPLYMVWRSARDRGLPGVGEAATRMLFPYSISRDIYDAARGNGVYRDLEPWDRIGKFIQQKIPGTRAISTGLALAGLSENNQKLDTDIKAFYRWKRDTFPQDVVQFPSDDERRNFRVQMKKAVEALKDGKEKEFYDSVDAAFEAAEELPQRGRRRRKPKQSIAASFLARRILMRAPNQELTDEELAALRKRIGDQAVDRLERYDAMLEAAAKGRFSTEED